MMLRAFWACAWKAAWSGRSQPINGELVLYSPGLVGGLRAARTQEDDVSTADVSEQGWRRIVRLALSDGVPRRALMVAAVIGTVLNLINQGDAIFGDAPVNLAKLILTYLVPYGVSTHGAVSARL
jgi:hypothetical protein